ncbi:TetR/AcrR family transcriptional regulator [Methylobacterium brachythecii]|uniref:TetR family transcriptional regulator n=1 Tax=Methylobacterium brachythecii TaxID=1176177 RepID=A0A7W6AFP4_9HYPH|nr:TetR/AcrR family transcriptional regulator [Methylobacterium brachythecii]MBB3900684.1 TetR/AcrR family transcriptional repressor of nem operon [Methylobacterium brachythecii]GLS43561.1 TetR family transcriptional regulator [Methylobacterium brachythecii]
MARVSREQALQNRDRLAQVAGRLFRERGMDGVGVAELSREAGMTHGALYSRFGSRDGLVAAAFGSGETQSEASMQAALGAAPSLDQILDFYVSARQRDNHAQCCPMLASASEAARQSDDLREHFARSFDRLSATIAQALDRDGEAPQAQTSHVIAAAMIGIVAVARAIQSADAQGSDALIAAAPSLLAALAKTNAG